MNKVCRRFVERLRRARLEGGDPGFTNRAGADHLVQRQSTGIGRQIIHAALNARREFALAV